MQTAKTEANAPILNNRSLHLGKSFRLIFVWVVTLLISSLPDILSHELHITLPISILWMRVIVLVVSIVISYFWHAAQALRPYFIAFLALILFDALFSWFSTTSTWQGWYRSTLIGFTQEMLGIQLLRLALAIVIIVVLWLLLQSPSF